MERETEAYSHILMHFLLTLLNFPQSFWIQVLHQFRDRDDHDQPKTDQPDQRVRFEHIDERH